MSEKNQGVTTQGRREVEIDTPLLGNDKSNVIADKVLSYFSCLSSKFEVYVSQSGTK